MNDCSYKVSANIYKGLDGNKGWTPVYADEEYDGKIIRQLVDYIGGQGDKPTDYLGMYLKLDGTYTSDKDEAGDYKGEKGDTGDDGNLILFSFKIEDNDLIFVYPEPDNSNVEFQIDNNGNLILEIL